MAFSERERRLALIAGLVFAVVVGISGARRLLTWAGGSGAESLAFGTEGLGELLDTLEDIDNLRSQNERVKKQLGNESMICIDESEISGLLKSIEEVGKRSGVKINNFNPTVRPKGKPMPSVEVKIGFECQFNQLVQFLANIEKPEIALFVRELRAGQKNPGQPQLNVTMTIVTYLVS